ncbi:hypothetical protein Kpho02_34350 [Kitasatospora phosalacinea]|uniref:Uncharacterized protein n=1 Tax=Kitasatospora phosalacinea TaxID=2065 RepID=A0A9W6Q9W7_9ACTN|nr:hypothetical protein [Kitasatospora phosalacinea]GLW71136.1 hypothetical protein Kpho02_34350 [Kitasatospora phosalacinea]
MAPGRGSAGGRCGGPDQDGGDEHRRSETSRWWTAVSPACRAASGAVRLSSAVVDEGAAVGGDAREAGGDPADLGGGLGEVEAGAVDHVVGQVGGARVGEVLVEPAGGVGDQHQRDGAAHPPEQLDRLPAHPGRGVGERGGELGRPRGGDRGGRRLGDRGGPLRPADPAQQQRQVQLRGVGDLRGGAGGEADGPLQALHLVQLVEPDEVVEVAQQGVERGGGAGVVHDP